jgi:hypothetical protein
MAWLTKMKTRVVDRMMGRLVVDLGTLTTDEHGRRMGLSIRQYEGRPAHLQVRYESGEVEYFQITRMREWADQFERVAQEMRKHV